MRSAIFLVLFAVLLVPPGALASESKDKPTEQPGAETAETPKPTGPKREAYEKLFAEWKDVISELISLQQEFVSADRTRREAIEKRYDELVTKGDALSEQVFQAAEEAFLEAPRQSPEILMFLMVRTNRAIKMDDYEEALRLVKLLLSQEATQKELYLWGGIAAFCTGELDLAQDYLATAVKKGVEIKTGHGDPLDPTLRMFQHDPRRHAKAWNAEQEIRAQEKEADDLPRVLLKTNRGDIELELFENEAPNTVANFISLVEKGFYDGLTFHRVLPGFMIQGGCPKGTGSGDPGYDVKCECYEPDHRKHFRGSLSMAHAGVNTGGSQFFITLIPTTHLDGKHTVFGRVIKGMDVLGKIHKRDPSDPKATLAPADEIISAKVLRKRDHEYKFEKIGDKK